MAIGGERGLGGDADLEIAGRGGGDAAVGVVPEDPCAGGDGERGFLGDVEDALGGGLDDGVLRAIGRAAMRSRRMRR